MSWESFTAASLIVITFENACMWVKKKKDTKPHKYKEDQVKIFDLLLHEI
jgi:hypothetical protein